MVQQRKPTPVVVGFLTEYELGVIDLLVILFTNVLFVVKLLAPAVREILRSWQEFEDKLPAIACLNADQLSEFGDTASKGIVLLNDILTAPKSDWSKIDLRVLTSAGQSFRRAAKQCKNGYLPVSTIVEAAQTLNFLYHYVLLLPNLQSVALEFPPEALKVLIRPEDIPSTVSDPDSYYGDMVVGLRKLVETIGRVFRAVKVFWSFG